ncbi:10091_t:CDS:2, partial [Scutellospora calospora]
MSFVITPLQMFKTISNSSFPFHKSTKLNQKNSPPSQQSTNNLTQNVTSPSTSKIASKIKFVKNLELPRKRYNNIIAFGDSFTDVGNVYNLSNNIWPSKTNYTGRFCNGKLWVEYLADWLNVELLNYAFGGATADCNFVQGSTGTKNHKFNVPGIKQQIEKFIAANTKSEQSNTENSKLQKFFNKKVNSKIMKKLLKKNDSKKLDNKKDFSKTLFTIWDTGNDYYFSDMSAQPLDVVKHLIDALHLLVKSIPTISTLLVPNLPDLSRVPAFKTMDPIEKEKISKMVGLHNKYLLEHLIKFNRETNVKIIYLRCDKFFDVLQTEVGMNGFGIINYSLEIVIQSESSKSAVNEQLNNDDSYFYWDDYHFSTKVHKFMANICFETLENSNPLLSTNKRDSFLGRMFGM